MCTSKWLRDLGAVRPMAAAGHHILVLGTWCEGQYPIEWQTREGAYIRDETGHVTGRERIETWHVFGIETARPLTQGDCQRILRMVRDVPK
jgi:hypothetical protein